MLNEQEIRELVATHGASVNEGRSITQLIDDGAPMLNETPNPGAHDCKVAFVHPKYLGGVLAELVEDPHS